MSGRVSSPSAEARDVLRALRRAAKRALEIGLQTGTPVWVVKNGELVDLTKEQPAGKRLAKRRATSKKPAK